MINCIKQVSLDDLIIAQNGKIKESKVDIEYGDFEYLKYLKANETPKLVKFNVNLKDGLTNYIKLDKFIKALQRQSFKKFGLRPEFKIENYKFLFSIIYKAVFNLFNEFDKVWDTIEVNTEDNLMDNDKRESLKIGPNDKLIYIRMAQPTSDRIDSNKLYQHIIINLDNTFPKKYALHKFKWINIDYKDYFCGKVITFNMSTFEILNDIITYYLEKHPESANRPRGKREDVYVNALYSLKDVLDYGKRSYCDDPLLELYLKKAIVEYEKYVNYVEGKKLQAEDSRLYAKAFMTKQNIKKDTLFAMKNNSFLENFSFVEIDDTVDLNKFRDLSEYFSEYRKLMPQLLPKVEDGVSFRIRRLGNYRANGVYFPYYDTVAVGVAGTSSFVHECGHWLDYKKFNNASMSDDFIEKITLPYKSYFKAQNSIFKTYAKSSESYYCSTREVFARAFEVYIKNKHFVNSSCPFLKTNEEYTNDIAYSWLTNNINIVNAFFNNLEDELEYVL